MEENVATGATLTLRRGDGDAGKASMAVGRATAVIARNVGMEKCILLLLRSSFIAFGGAVGDNNNSMVYYGCSGRLFIGVGGAR